MSNKGFNKTSCFYLSYVLKIKFVIEKKQHNDEMVLIYFSLPGTFRM